MLFYFTLQYRRALRRLRHLGVPPVLVLPLGAIGFPFFTAYLYGRFAAAGWILAVLTSTVLWTLAARDRTRRLRQLYIPVRVWMIRGGENLAVAAPALAALAWYGDGYPAGALLLAAVLLARITTGGAPPMVLPTPFRRQPFECVAGFRRRWWLIALLYLVAINALRVENLTLALFTVLLLGGVVMSWYATAEPPALVWIFALPPAAFLEKKLRTASGAGLLLTLPVLAGTIWVFPQRVLLILAVGGLAVAYALIMVLAKYATYPREMSIPRALALTVVLLLPPLLPAAAWKFYGESKRRLAPLLE
ncbi:hypothetical protein [Lewinella sp. IMCC34183]|uniref:hypothetical protein n=1 Tax=Lewinella sp. IMCC34183 TaxID=2248762 RepID=UPI000E27DDFF|nr:hypothetical protein [Lewinella sp. IMCC34183]